MSHSWELPEFSAIGAASAENDKQTVENTAANRILSPVVKNERDRLRGKCKNRL